MDYPEKDELVVVKINQILNYGVFVELLEYNNMRGFVHISNVSSSWVKNIRNIVKMNQVRVAKVMNVDIQKRQIDLSFAGVSSQREKQKLTEFKQVNREEKLIELLAKQEKKKFNDVWKEVAEPLIEEFGSLYEAFEKISLGRDFSNLIPKNWVAPVNELVEKNIVVSVKSLSATIKATSLKESGLENIKKIFSEVEAVKGCNVIYQGAGSYKVTCSAQTFKEAEKTLEKINENAEKNSKKLGVSFSFKMDEEK